MKFRFAILLIGAIAALEIPSADSALGKVKVDDRARAISFPAEVNQRAGQIEYLVVHEQGKIHESIFKTPVNPRDIHAASLLFSATNQTAPILKQIEIFWQADGKEKRFKAADLILDKKKKRALGETKWAYLGSRLIDGSFMAEREGSIIAVREDRHAIIEQATPDAADDENWEPLTENVPPIGTKVTVEFRFAE